MEMDMDIILQRAIISPEVLSLYGQIFPMIERVTDDNESHVIGLHIETDTLSKRGLCRRPLFSFHKFSGSLHNAVMGFISHEIETNGA